MKGDLYMKSYLIKNKKYTFMIIFFISLFIIPFKANALTIKGTQDITFTNSNDKYGQITNSQQMSLIYSFNELTNITNYDYIGFRIQPYFDKETAFYIDNPYLEGPYNGYTFQCTNGNDYCQTANILPKGGISIPQDLSGTSYSGDFVMSGAINYSGNTNGTGCFMTSELQNVIVCPLNANPVNLTIYISGYHLENLYYKVYVSGYAYLINNDTTDLVNALTNVQQQQINTVTTIENFNNYVSDTNTTQSETASTTALGGITTEFNSHLSDMNQLTQLAFVPVNFILNIADSTCQPLIWEIPFVNQRVVVPCMSTIYNGYFSVVVGTFSIIMTSLLTYRCCLKLFNTIKGLLDAEDDKIEVVDL